MAQQVADNTRQSVIAGTITAGHLRSEMVTSMIQCLHTGAIDRWMMEPCGPYLDMGRNRVVRHFLNYPQFKPDDEEEWTQDFLYFWDSDVEAKPAQITALVETAEKWHADQGTWPIVGGCYQGVDSGGVHPIVYRWVDVPEDKDYPRQLHTLTSAEIIAEDTPLCVDAIGTGSMLIHRSILLEMAKRYQEPQPWFYEGPLPGMGPAGSVGQWFGEDLFFCFRATALGHPIIAHRGVRLMHYKDIGLPFTEEQ